MLNNPFSFVGTPTRLFQAAITASPVAIYTTPTNTRTAIYDIVVCNTTSVDIAVNLFAGSGATTANALLYGYDVPANGITSLNGLLVLNSGDNITVSAATTGLSITGSGMEQV